MINSMTGYGNAEGRLSGVTYVVEISAVNNRYFKPTLRLPETLGFLESDVEKELRREVSRGTVNYMLRQKGAPAEALFDINEKALATLLKRLGRISPSGGLERELDLGGLLALPGILSPAVPGAKAAAGIRRKVLAVTRQGEQSFVYVAQQQDGHFVARQTQITLGDTVGNTYSVSSGLNVGDRVIVSSTQFLVNGMPVLPLPGA